MRIAFVHQGYELYGSDRSFIETVTALAEPGGDVEAVIPRAGPIEAPLAATGARVVIEPRLWILRRRHLATLATLGLVRLVPALWRAARRFRRCDLVYVNTAVVLDHLVAARFFPGKAVVHVHEMPIGVARRVLRALLIWSRAELVFNSRATAAAYGLDGRQPTHVVHNGVAPPRRTTPASYDGTRPLRALMVGRINRDKGQDVLIEALAALPGAVRDRLEIRIVGGSFEDPELEAALKATVRREALAATVSFLPFTDDPEPHFHWADIVIVPSKTTESLGRVAIEAMSHGRPPVVSGLGGLREGGADGVTGWGLPPADADALSAQLARIVTEPASWRDFPEAARRRYAELFSPAVAAARIRDIVGRKVGARLIPPPQGRVDSREARAGWGAPSPDVAKPPPSGASRLSPPPARGGSAAVPARPMKLEESVPEATAIGQARGLHA